jgi:CRP-like cAMP-binding protein
VRFFKFSSALPRPKPALVEFPATARFSNGTNWPPQGQVADAVFYVQQGKVKLTVVSEHGKEAVVAILRPGQFFWRSVSEWPSAARARAE